MVSPLANVEAGVPILSQSQSLFPALPAVVQHPLVSGGLLLHPDHSDDLVVRNFLDQGAPKGLVELLKRIAKDGKLTKDLKEELFNFASHLSSNAQVEYTNHQKTIISLSSIY